MNENITITADVETFGQTMNIRSTNKTISMRCSMDLVRDMQEIWGIDMAKFAPHALDVIEKNGGKPGAYSLAMSMSDGCVSFKIAPTDIGETIKG